MPDFKASGNCTNCSQTVTVIADDKVVESFVLNYHVISNIHIPLTVPASKISFDQNFSIDDLKIHFQ